MPALTWPRSTSESSHEWLRRPQRWFGSKAREVATIHVARRASRCATSRRCWSLALVEARFPGGTHESTSCRSGCGRRQAGRARDRRGRRLDVYDALRRPGDARELLHRHARDGAEVHGEHARSRSTGRATRAAAAGRRAPVGVEQSNSSIVFGDALILKAFRRVEPGDQPRARAAALPVRARLPARRRARRAGTSTRASCIDATLGVVQELRGRRPRRLGAGARRAGRRTPSASSTRLRDLGAVIGAHAHRARPRTPPTPPSRPRSPPTSRWRC